MKIVTNFDTKPHLGKLRYGEGVFSDQKTKKSLVSNLKGI